VGGVMREHTCPVPYCGSVHEFNATERHDQPCTRCFIDGWRVDPLGVLFRREIVTGAATAPLVPPSPSVGVGAAPVATR
jgi:hypothetical protein